MNHTNPNFTLINGYLNGAAPSPLAFALGIAPKDLCSLRGELRWDSQLMGQPQMGRTHGLKITRKPCQN